MSIALMSMSLSFLLISRSSVLDGSNVFFGVVVVVVVVVVG